MPLVRAMRATSAMSTMMVIRATRPRTTSAKRVMRGSQWGGGVAITSNG